MRRPLKALMVLVPAVAVGLLALPTVAGANSGTVAPATFSFSGAGWGHGVGLSQVGARGQAAEGRSAPQILRHYFTGTSVAAYRDDMDLRVNVQYLATAVRFRLEALSSSAAFAEITAGSKKFRITPKDEITVVRNGSSMTIKRGSVPLVTTGDATVRWSGTRNPGGSGRAAAVLNVVGGTESLTSSGHRYRYGHLDLRARYSTVVGRTALTAVNVVRLHDEYLRGIGEMPSSWPSAALQAQVIASRNYALVKYRAGVRTGCGCHVFDDTADQVFVGYSKEAGTAGNRWVAAVKATNSSSTHSLVVLYMGIPAQTFYFSSSGGRTQNSEDVWGSRIAYLRSVDDHWSRNRTYNGANAGWGPAVRSQSAVAKAFGLKDVARIDLSDRYASGTVRTARAWSTRGVAANLAGSSLPRALSLTSRWVWLTTPPAVGIPKRFTVTPANLAPSGRVGSTIALTGSVGPADRAAKAKVSLQRWNGSSRSWVFVSSTTVTAKGTYAFAVGARYASLASYRVYKPSSACGKRCLIKQGLSSTIRVSSIGSYALTTTITETVKVGSRPTVSGVVSPVASAAGKSVTINRWDKGKGTWVSVGNARVSSKGAFKTLAAPLPSGAHRLMVFVPKGLCVSKVCLLASASSQPKTVTSVEAFAVKAVATSKSGAVTISGTVSPTYASQGDVVTISLKRGTRWIYVGAASIDAKGRYLRTFGAAPRGVLQYKVMKAAEGCGASACVHPAFHRLVNVGV